MSTVPLHITEAPVALPRAPRTTADRCPTAIALHAAADGLIARVRLPGGRLSVAQARVLAGQVLASQTAAAAGTAGTPGVASAADPGFADSSSPVGSSAGPGPTVLDAALAADDRIELTMRGNLQLRGLRSEQSGLLAAALFDAGLLPSIDHDQARAILASPVAGRLAGAAPVDRLVREIDEAICLDPALAKLSGRFLTAVDDGTGLVDCAAADLAIAMLPRGLAHPLAGPSRIRSESVAIHDGLSADGVEAAAEGGVAVLLVAGVPAGTVAVANAPAALAAAARAFLWQAGGTAWRISELPDGGASLRAQLLGDGVLGPLARADWPAAKARPLPPLGAGVQADGRHFARALAPLGRLTAAQLSGLADVAQSARSELRIAADRSITLIDLAPKHTAAALKAIAGLGLIVEAQDASIGLTACAGLGCEKARGDVRAAARLRLATRRAGDPREHLVGCERRCGAPAAGTTLVLQEHESPETFARRTQLAAQEHTS